VIGINGAAARLIQPGDLVIIIGYAHMDDTEAHEHQPRVVFLDAHNRISSTGHDPAEALTGTRLLRGDVPLGPSDWAG
jgi:aspartate 1-decarboxylase